MTSAAGHTLLEPVSPDNAVLLFVDQQEGLFRRIHEPQQTRACLIALARSARLLGIPAVMTTAPAAGPNRPQLPELTETFAGQEIIDRTLINAWLDSRAHEAITHTGRKKVIIAGTGLDVCSVACPGLRRRRLRHLRRRRRLRAFLAGALGRDGQPPDPGRRRLGGHSGHRLGSDGGQRTSRSQQNLRHPASRPSAADAVPDP